MTLSEDGLRPVRERTEIIQASINLFLILVHHHLFEVEKTLQSAIKSERSAFSLSIPLLHTQNHISNIFVISEH